jgi:hypothetical protein
MEKRQMAYGVRDQLGLEPKTLVIVTYSMAAVGIFPSTMTISEVFVEDEKHKGRYCISGGYNAAHMVVSQ